MFNENQIERYADVLLWGLKTARAGKIKKNEIVLIRFDLAAVKLAEALQRNLINAGMNVVFRLLQTPIMEKQFYHLSGPRQLVFIPPGEEELYRNLNGAISLLAPESLTHLKEVDPAKITKALKARKNFRTILDEREEKGLFSWTLAMYPTQDLARHAGMSMEDYAEQIAGACFLNQADPVDQWKSIYHQAKTIKEWLNGMKVAHYHVESQHTDLIITPGEQRRWIGISGHNIPSFELFISPDWRGTKGVYYADQPSYRSGNYVKGIRIEFQKGKAVNASAEEGEAFLNNQIAMDAGASRLGEFSLTDKTFSKIGKFMANTLFDENYGGEYGNCHVALGASYSETYSGNPSELTNKLKTDLGFNDSALHWDIVNTESKRVTAHLSDGRATLIYEDGRFAL